MNDDIFDYKNISEERETLDFSKLVPCPHCKKDIPHDSLLCLYCGEDVFISQKSPWMIGVAIIVVIIIVVLFVVL